MCQSVFFLDLHKSIHCGRSLGVLWWHTPNEWIIQLRLLWRNKKNINTFCLFCLNKAFYLKLAILTACFVLAWSCNLVYFAVYITAVFQLYYLQQGCSGNEPCRRGLWGPHIGGHYKTLWLDKQKCFIKAVYISCLSVGKLFGNIYYFHWIGHCCWLLGAVNIHLAADPMVANSNPRTAA